MRRQFLGHKPDITPHRRSGGRRLRRLGSAAGFMLVAIGASATILSANTSWASGSTVRSDSIAIAQNAYDYPQAFDSAITKTISDLRAADPSASGTADRFYAAYASASQDYSTALKSAAQLYADSVSKDPAGAKDAYINNYAAARSFYFGELETAKADVVSELAGQNDTAKDAFVNEFNAARDTYNNQLETIKTEIASLHP